MIRKKNERNEIMEEREKIIYKWRDGFMYVQKKKKRKGKRKGSHRDR